MPHTIKRKLGKKGRQFQQSLKHPPHWLLYTVYPIQFLQIQSHDAPRDDSFREAAKILRAGVETLAVDDEDVSAVVRWAANAPVAQSGDQGDRWEESGYWLLPLLGLILLGSFRREQNEAPTGEVSA